VTLATVNNLAGLYWSQGRFGEAEPLFRRALETRERVLGPEHPGTLGSLNNLAGLYERQGRYGEAETLKRRGLEASERVLGPEHPQTLISVNSLAGLYESQGRYGEAEPLYRRALETRERVLGPEHSDTLVSVNNLAALYDSQGRFGEAEPLYRRALQAAERVLGPEHPNTVATRGNLAVLLVRSGRAGEALRELRALDLHLGQWLDAELRTTRAAALQREALRLNSVYQNGSYTLALARPSEAAASFAAELVLRWKKRLMESDAATNRVLSASDDPELRSALEDVQLRYAALSQAAFASGLDEGARLTMREELEEAEAQLRLKVRELGLEDASARAGLAQVQAALPQGAALIEYRFFNPYDFATDVTGPERLLAVVIAPRGVPRLVDLGELPPELLDARVLARGAALRGAKPTGGSDLPPIARSGYDRLIAPVLAQLDGVQALILSPDGPLHALPFEAFLDPENRRLIERYQVRLVQTGRDLVGRGRPLAGRGLVAVGGVDFGPALGASELMAPVEVAKTDVSELELGQERALDITRNGIGDFGYLKASLAEAESVAKAYAARYPDEPVAAVLSGSSASETALKQLAFPPRVLHLATHGFYLADEAVEGRPLLQSGVALAGANRALAGEALDGENGVLHAEEVQALNLEGTELVVLSACDTGQGAPDYSEGLEGLPRAFRVAGARHVLVALWPIGDEAARDFMERFYARWLAQENSDLGQALQETKLEYIRSGDPRERDPSVWAPFVLFEG
jgi:CHAT domain-containing protein/Tfp pilus assembly protein PilF